MQQITPTRKLTLLLWGVSALFSAPLAFAGEPLAPPEAAARIDAILNAEYTAAGVTPAHLVGDEDFLRRITLDLAGRIPEPRQVTLFGLDPDPEKRSRIVNKLLQAEEFSVTWASYWRDVIFLRATEQRARLVQPTFEDWMKDQLEQQRSWSQITSDLITATGPISENGATGLIFAHTGDPQELTAEISRIFLGIQMSCANCHDHPYDSWKRQQFHELAAFLPRVSVRRTNPGDPRSFTVTSLSGNERAPREQFDFTTMLRLLDRNRDGKLSKSEVRGPLAERFDQMLASYDKNKDGMLSAEELKEARPPIPDQPGRGSAEYYMPDLHDPSSRGTLVQPVFLLKDVPGPRLRPGADDMARRRALADYITSKQNPWFARAFVNRLWSELVGEGFYMPIDDIGPEREARMEPALEILTQGFIDNDYNIRWVFSTITHTQAYRRSIRSKPSEGEPAFASASPTRLRSDQLYHSIVGILGTGQMMSRGTSRGIPQGQGMYPQLRGEDAGKAIFAQLFGFDPSTPQEDLVGNVPQALFLMNSPLISLSLSSAGNTKLARLLRDFSDDEDALAELYLLVMSREPTLKELEINRRYITELGRRGEAYEDILWTLVNSTEFQTRR